MLSNEELELRLKKQVELLQRQLNTLNVQLQQLRNKVTHPSALKHLKNQAGDLLGTTNRILVTRGEDAVLRNDDTIVSTPQDIHTGATPTFAWLLWSGTKRVGTQFDAINVTLVNVTDLSVNLEASKNYFFKAFLFVDADAVGGHKYAIGGTATAGSVLYQINSINNGTNLFVINSRENALGGSAGEASATVVFTEIHGMIVTTGAGTLTVQFAQNVANGTSSVLVNSYFIVEQMA